MTIDRSSVSHEAAAERTQASCAVRCGSLWSVIGGRLRASAALSVAILLTACGGGGGGSDAGTTGGGSTGGGSGGGGGGTQSYTVGGTISGLSGSGLTLQVNAGGDLAVSSSGTFTFAMSVASGASYSVSIKTQPSNPAQTCVLGNASGTVGSANVTNVSVTCTTNTYIVGGAVSGLSADSTLVLQQGSEELAISGNGSFVFATSVLSGALYNVTVKTQPTASVQNCVVTNATGTMGSAAVINVVVTCDGIALLAGALGGRGNLDGVLTGARFNRPWDVVIDSGGNKYVADSLNHTIRKIAWTGLVTVLAGTTGVSGNVNGTGTAARFNSPRGLVIDSAGNLYVADTNNHAIRKITSAGVVSTLAGAGAAGSADGTGSAAQFRFPVDIAIDAAGTLYLADTDNHTIRKVTAAGVVTTLAGTAGTSGTANGSGSAARFSSPAGLVTDAAGNVYVADTGNHTIRKITAAGVVSTLAGTAGTFGADDGTGSAARFYSPRGLAIDTAGNVYVADTTYDTIRKVTAAGVVSTFVGTATQSGYADGTGGAARFNSPYGITTDSADNVYVADSLNHTIRKITAAGVVSTLAGKAFQSGYADGSGTAARFGDVRGVATDAAGNVYVAATGSNTIRKITPAGVVSTLAGAVGQYGSEDGSGTAARFDYPFGVAADSAGNVYVADTNNSTIRKITPAGVVSTFAGAAGQPGSDDGIGSAARFDEPYSIAIDATNNVYVADSNAIRKITPAGVVSTLAGAVGQSGPEDGIGSAARFNVPHGLDIDSAGNVYVADTGNHTIRKITPAGVVSTLAGVAPSEQFDSGFVDGIGSAARFFYPNDVAVDAAGNVYVADMFNNAIRRITPDGTVTTVAGTKGSSGNRLGPLPGSLSTPRYIALLPGPRITLVETDEEEGILLITLP